MDINYRDATVLDSGDITRMWAKMIDEISTEDSILERDGFEKERFMAFLVSRVLNPVWFVIVATYEGKIIGYIMGEVRNIDFTKIPIGVCDSLYVEKGYRFEGIGKHLIKMIEEKARVQYQIKYVDIMTVHNDRLINRWEKQRFRPVHITYRKAVI